MSCILRRGLLDTTRGGKGALTPCAPAREMCTFLGGLGASISLRMSLSPTPRKQTLLRPVRGVERVRLCELLCLRPTIRFGSTALGVKRKVLSFFL